MVEPNKAGVLEMRKLFADYRVSSDQYEIKECMIEQADLQGEFDIIIAEGFLHSIDNAGEIISRLCGLVKKGGIIVITCMDSFSMFVEQIKRLVCHVLIKDISDYEKQVKECVGFFEKQMKSLEGMSRSIEDWVRDDILNPAFNNANILTIEMAFKTFPENFSYLGSSQRIFTDYSWYKDLEYDERMDMIQQYRTKRHNFLMTGLRESIISEKDSVFLEKKIRELRKHAIKYEKKHELSQIDAVIENLNIIKPMMQRMNQVYGEFIGEAMEILGKVKNNQDVKFEKYKTFYKSTGRTQQYLSMVRNRY